MTGALLVAGNYLPAERSSTWSYPRLRPVRHESSKSSSGVHMDSEHHGPKTRPSACSSSWTEPPAIPRASGTDRSHRRGPRRPHSSCRGPQFPTGPTSPFRVWRVSPSRSQTSSVSTGSDAGWCGRRPVSPSNCSWSTLGRRPRAPSHPPLALHHKRSGRPKGPKCGPQHCGSSVVAGDGSRGWNSYPRPPETPH